MKVGGGGGERRKRLRTNPSILKTCVRQRTQRLIGSASRTMLTCVDQRFVSYWDDGMVRDTYINFQWLLFILVGKICQRIFFDLFWNVRLFLRLNKVSGRLIYIYFLFKVHPARVIKNQNRGGICWPPAERVRGGEGENSLVFFLALRARSRSPMFSKRTKRKRKQRLCTG